MQTHPMEVNVNTRLRWEAIKDIPYLTRLKGRKVLDVGAGLGYFSLKLRERGAEVMAIDVDPSSMDFLRRTYQIPTEVVDAEHGNLPQGPFYLVFAGEVIEHVKNPTEFLRKIRDVLEPGGLVLLSTPALEGWLTDTQGKRLCHEDGAEKHERDGFTREELESYFQDLGMNVVYHSYSVHTLAELFMQLTKLGYLRERKSYSSQADVVNLMATAKYKLLKTVYPVLNTVFTAERQIAGKLGLRGHCHIMIAQKQGTAH